MFEIKSENNNIIKIESTKLAKVFMSCKSIPLVDKQKYLMFIAEETTNKYFCDLLDNLVEINNDLLDTFSIEDNNMAYEIVREYSDVPVVVETYAEVIHKISTIEGSKEVYLYHKQDPSYLICGYYSEDNELLRIVPNLDNTELENLFPELVHKIIKHDEMSFEDLF